MDKPKKDVVTRFCEWLFRCEKNREKLEQERREKAAEMALLAIMDLSKEVTLLAAKFMMAGQQVRMIGAGSGADWASREAKNILKECVVAIDELVSLFERYSADMPSNVEAPKVTNGLEWALTVEECAVSILHEAALLQEGIFFEKNDVEVRIEILKEMRIKAIGWL